MGLTPTNNALEILRQAGRNLKCQYVGEKVKQGTEYINHSMFLGNEADMLLHMKNLQAYLKENPGDIDTRISLAFLKMMFPGN